VNGDEGWGHFGDERWGTGRPRAPVVQPPEPAPKPSSDHARRRRRTLIAVVVTIASLVRLVLGLGVFHGGGAQPHAPSHANAAPAPTRRLVFYGDVRQVPPSGVPRDTAICTAEVRMRPTSGPWTCVSWTSTGTSDVAFRAAGAASGACTHRIVLPPNTAWTCETTIPPPRIVLDLAARSQVPLLIADLRLKRDSHGSVCNEETRSSPTGGEWHCLRWERLDPKVPAHLLQPIDPGGPCTVRSADEITGVWTCETRY
jgi:hypothetical protein